MKARLISKAGSYMKGQHWTPEEVTELDIKEHILEVECGKNKYHLRSDDQGRLEIYGDSIGTLWAHNSSGNLLTIQDQPLFTRAIFVKEDEFA